MAVPHIRFSDLCGVHISKRPYGELGSVDRSTCLCCVSVDSAFGPISPGCGCDAETVDELVVLLKERMRTRGDTAQIQRAEQTLKRLDEVDAKLVCMKCCGCLQLKAIIELTGFFFVAGSNHGASQHS